MFKEDVKLFVMLDVTLKPNVINKQCKFYTMKKI